MLVFKVATSNMVSSAFPAHFFFFKPFFPLMIISPASLQNCMGKCCHPVAFPVPAWLGAGGLQRAERGKPRGFRLEFKDLLAPSLSLPDTVFSNQGYGDSKHPAKHTDYSLAESSLITGKQTLCNLHIWKVLIFFSTKYYLNRTIKKIA